MQSKEKKKSRQEAVLAVQSSLFALCLLTVQRLDNQRVGVFLCGMRQSDGFEPEPVLFQSQVLGESGVIYVWKEGGKKRKRQSASLQGRRTKNRDRNTIQLMSKKVTPGRFSSHVSQSHESLQG